MELQSKIYVAGIDNIIGMAVFDALRRKGYQHVVTSSSVELDLTNKTKVVAFFKEQRPEYVFFAASKMGGIQANIDYPVDFMYDNLLMECNVIDTAYHSGVERLLYLASSCIYPRECPQPIKEAYLLTGPLEKTNEYYALARIAGVKLCEAYNKQFKTHFVPCMLANIYGPGDEIDLQKSHVIPALIKKFHDAVLHKKDHVVVWGTGKPWREFLYTDDLGEACVHIMLEYEDNNIINVGTGTDISIFDLAKLVAVVVGFSGKIIFDSTKPDGTSRKLLDVSKLKGLGWFPSVSMKEGLQETFTWYLKNSMVSLSNNYASKQLKV